MADRRMEQLLHLDMRDILQRNPDDLIRYVDFSDADLAIKHAGALHEAMLTPFSALAEAVAHIRDEEGFGIVAHRLDHASKPHFHDYMEVTHVLDGGVILWVEGAVVTLREGDTVVIHPHARHVIAPVPHDGGASPVEIDALVTLPMLERCHMAVYELDDSLYRWAISPDVARRYVYVSAGEEPRLVASMSRLIVHYGSSEDHILHYGVMGALMECLHYLGRAIGERATPLPPLAADVLRVIEEDLVHACVARVAGRLGYSSGYLMRYVKAVTGDTLGSLITQTRLRHAAGMLMQSNHTVGDIAASVGFRSPSHFYKRFQEQFSLTPSQYREIFAKAAIAGAGAQTSDCCPSRCPEMSESAK